MLTKNEITALNLSPTKKDFVQIWNELLEVAGRLSERWDPTSTNESDPGIVILKALTGIADKLNYNIDKNILEAFMPTAAQEDSMRKLCDMLGYNVKYYRSAETTVDVKYHNSDSSVADPDAIKSGLLIPKFTVITNSDQDINYFTTESVYISTTTPSVPIKCMEGQIVKCESTTDNYVITTSQISDSNRFYLPEYQIAENGIFVYNVVANNEDGDTWEKVDNLNIQTRGSRVFKFGYDSYEGRPYIEFPDDYSELINDGLYIYYARTSGANGNVSARTLTQLELPNVAGWDSVSAESFSAENAFSATTGSNIETIGQAYNNFKKTIGTFETLVTCRDYMNKIYSMTNDTTGKYLVSNALVTDIRTDLNRAVTICSCDDAGIFYKATPLSAGTTILNSSTSSITSSPNEEHITESVDEQGERKQSDVNKPVFNPNRSVSGSNWFLRSADGIPLAKADFIDKNYVSNFSANVDGRVEAIDGYWWIIQGGSAFRFKTVLPVEEIVSTTSTITKTITKTITNTNVSTVETSNAIDHFDLVLYPFKSYNQIRNNVKDIQAVYDKSFEYASEAVTIKKKLDQSDIKTIAHNIILPREHDIISINNYLRLNAIIGTTSKVTIEEGELLIEKIKIALANAFNMRELDFGEEIPFDSILNVIENADARISVVSLTEPALYTTFSVYEGTDVAANPIVREYAVASDWLSETYADASNRFEYTSIDDTTKANKYFHTFNKVEAKKIYNRLAVRNVLAGRIPLFKYNTAFKTSFSDGAYRVTDIISSVEVPAGLAVPDANNPFTIYTENNITYTGQLIVSPSGESTITYTKTYVPDEYLDNIIAKNQDDDTNYTELEAKCEILADKDINGEPTAYISEVKLADGEFIKFRAPNFITNKTYPAYVNYHLKLNRPSGQAGKDPKAAKAKTLYSLLADKTNLGERWRDTLFAYFKNSSNKRKFTLTQTVYGRKIDDEKPTSSNITLKLDNADKVDSETTTQILDKSGFVRLVSGKAIIKPSEPGTVLNNSIDIPDICLHGDSYDTVSAIKDKTPDNVTQYILYDGIFSSIKTITDMCLRDMDVNILPDKDWTISYEFEYIPFELASLAEWERFIKASTSLLGFSPVTEYNTSLWRIHQGSYQVGKYILPDGISKLMPFMGNHFGLLDSNRLSSVYVVEDVGKDAVPDCVQNDVEYQLRQGEYLYIEYTPSTTADDGTTKTQEPIKEVLSAGTIIKPSGFDGNGLLSADALFELGKTAHKTVTFNTQDGASSNIDVKMYSLGANEQIAIRELSKVTLNSAFLSKSSTVYVYKNFSGCDELEKAAYDQTGKRINNSYTLKDGEYIFYTDQNKSEFAYYASGTKVTLEGSERIVIPKRELIDISVIFDAGIQEIPWSEISFDSSDAITFQEFQYITLGPNDTLRSLQLYDTAEHKLDGAWKKCTDATYTVYGVDELVKLPNISLADGSGGNGWDVCSILELNTSPNKAQTLRTTDKVQTSIELYKTPASGIGERELACTVKATDANHPISFKANLPCISRNGKININDIYLKADSTKSLELKVMSEQPPAIMKTERGKLTPCMNNDVYDIANLGNNAIKTFSTKSYDELWTRVPLTDLASPNQDESDESYDKSLKLSVSILPNTYGVFSIYLKYGKDVTAGLTSTDCTSDASTAETWIELIQGSSENTIELLNDSNTKYSNGRLRLNPGINCIRVNKTCDLFVKTSFTINDSSNENASNDESVSTLYFDDLRLVDCRPIEYIENGEKKQQKTQGLNLAQIGYLDTADIDPLNSFDLQIRRNIRKECTESALNALDARNKLEDLHISTAEATLQKDKAKLKSLVNFIDTAKTELDTLLSNAEEFIVDELFNKYNELCRDLKQENDLLEALKADKNVSELEKQLNNLLARLGNYESAKQDLLSKLNELDIAATNRAATFTKEGLSKGAILDDFESVASNDEQLVSDLKLFSLKEVNAEYSARLEKLTEKIEAVSSDSAKTALLEILADVNIAKHEKLITQIQELISTKQNALISLLDEIKELVGGSLDQDTSKYKVDYVLLRATLISLREYLVGADIAEILSEIDIISNSAMENADKYSELIRIVNELNSLLDASGEAAIGNYASILTTVNSILENVELKITSNNVTPDTAIVTSVDSLYTEVNNIYIKQLRSLLADLKITLEAIEDIYIEAINSLNNEEAVKPILSELNNYKDIRLAQISTIEGFGTTPINEAYLSLPYGTLSVLSVWPAYMKHAYMIALAKLYRDIRIAINTPSAEDDLTLDDNLFAGDDLRLTLATIIDLTAFQQLFDQAKTLVTMHSQSTKRVDLVNALGALITPSVKLTEALEIIRNDSDTYADRNSVLKQLINSWSSASTVVEKQNILKELSNELKSVIEIDTELVEICAQLLCPSILLFPLYNITNVDGTFEDAFYGRLRDYISEKKLELLDMKEGFADKLGDRGILGYLGNAYEITKALLDAIEAKDINEFTQLDTITSGEESDTLLTSEYLDILIDIKYRLDIKSQIDNITSSKLLSMLQKDLVVAWQDKLEWEDSNNKYTSYNWLDSNGNYYQKFTNYLDQEKPARWVAYPSTGTSTDQMNWLKAEGQWTNSATSDGAWLTHNGLIVNVDAKREYNGSTWLDNINNEIIIRDTNGWLSVDGKYFIIADSDLEAILTNSDKDGLLDEVEALGQLNYMSDEAKAAHSILWLETQLLNEIRELDRNNEFYYNVPIETSVAIDFHESDSKLNTLMNPAVNYDINNINNNFVISKLDINYLTSGLQIARSSKLS